MVDEKKLKGAIKARDEFLEEHPILVAYQQELDRTLAECNSPSERLALVMNLLTRELNKLKFTVEAFHAVDNDDERDLH